MAYPSVTYTFTNGTTASATEVNQNFTDLVNGLSDGTKDLSIAALTCAGTATLNGAVNLGNATSDDIAVNGYLTTALIPKADDSYDLGTAALAWQDGYFEGIVYTDAIKALTSAGVTITDDGGVSCVACADGGAVTLGPASGGSLQHVLQSGALTSLRLLSTGDNTAYISLYSNSAEKWQIGYDKTTGPGTVGSFYFYDSVGAKYTGSCTPTGAWTLGPAAGLTTTNLHTINGTTSTSTAALQLVKKTGSDSASNYYMQCIAGTGSTEQGGLWNNASGDFIYYTASDARIKTDIRDADYGLKEILCLRPKVYTKRGIPNCKGFIAQEVKEVLPESVGIKSNDEFDDFHILETGTMIPVMVKAIQELAAQAAELSAKLDAQAALLDEQSLRLEEQAKALDEANARIAALEAK